MGNNSPSPIRFSIITGTGAFFAAIFFSFFFEVILPKFQILIISFLFLIIVVFTGIVFDMIGVATAVAAEHPFHAKAAKKLKGARHAILLIRNAHKVSVYCSDVVGDICGTVSGALGAAIIIQFVTNRPGLNVNHSLLAIIMTGIVASFTVGGKAFGKHKALEDSEQIIFLVGRALGWLESTTGIKILSGNLSKGRGKR